MPRALHPDLVSVAALIREAGIVAPQASDGVAGARAYSDAVGDLVTRGSAALRQERIVRCAGPHGDVPAKLYWPDDAHEPPSLVFYLHGGGFRQGALSGWDAAVRQLVRASGLAVLSIDYRLAPEHRFPVALEETLAVMRAVIADCRVDGAAVAGFAAGGDSAGANLALAAALVLRDEGAQALRSLVLFYGVYSTDISARSWREMGGAFGLSISQMQAIWDGYLGGGETDWRVEPIRADLTGLPSTRIIVGDLDPLLDENVALAVKLRAMGVGCTLTVLPNANHGFVRFADVASVVGDAVQAEGAALAAAFGRQPARSAG